MGTRDREKGVTRRQALAGAAGAAAGFLLTACGPRRLVELSGPRLEAAIAAMEERYRAEYGTKVTVIPGLTPDTLGEIYEYRPTRDELLVAAGIFSVGFLLFTLMLKVAIPVALGEFAFRTETAAPATLPAARRAG
ncbi:MAG TPA: hypothetical protein VGQ83_17480 [Polyangia bacterium]|jgi:Ni/Fe-hydrogenase subunit HybB-like protein